MKLEEDLLHYIWPLIKSQKIKLETTNGESIQIIHCGILNHSEGPDFNEAQIKIGDQLWAGTYRGERVMQGNYMYMVNLVYQNETRFKTEGQVLLLE